MCRIDLRAHNRLEPNNLHGYLLLANNATVMSRMFHGTFFFFHFVLGTLQQYLQ